VMQKSLSHIEEYVSEILRRGGEGIMLRKPESLYENGRSHYILKYKKSRDGEARVLEIKGVYLICELPNRKVFTAKKSVEMGHQVVRAGDIVTFKNAKSPQIFRVRRDLRWEDVVNSAFSSSRAKRSSAQ